MTTSNAKAFGDPQTLAHVLEFLARLEDSQLKTTVIEEIKKNVKDYINNKLTDFATEDGSGGYLYKSIQKSKELRKKIVKSEENYEHYKNRFNDNNANKYTKYLIDNIFAIFGCLYYMYYECNDNCVVIYGNEWHDERCNGTGTKGENLKQWLKDETGKDVRSRDKSSILMIKRGFQEGELSNKKGEELFPSTKSGKAEPEPLLDYRDGAQLQFCLYYMLFLSDKWNNAQSGHAVLFLQAFCEMASENKFNVQYTAAENGGDEKFKTACRSVADKISTLMTLNIIAPVAAENKTVKYTDLLQPEHFSKYIEWLKENLKMLIDSLQAMTSDAKNWDAGKLITSETYGPFPWGFTFNNPNWDQKKGQLQQQLEQQLSQLNEELESFKEKVQSLSATRSKGQSESDTEKPSASSASINSAEKPSPATEESSASTVSTTSTTSADSTDSNESTNSTSSTVGRVIGGVGAAAATAGAAYAGSGFLGPVAEAVGKFFKGLLF